MGLKQIIAGSTHSGEDEIFLPVFSKIKKEFEDVKLLVAPRHPKRQEAVKKLIETTGLEWGLRSIGDKFDDKDIILLDTMGELGKVYALCDFAFIGGSFNKTGGHNPLEATVFEKPVISEKSTSNFKDIYALLAQSGAAKIVEDAKELENYMCKLLSHNDFYTQCCNDCKTVFAANQGALDVVIAELNTLN